jgi:hypothetical protein
MEQGRGRARAWWKQRGTARATMPRTKQRGGDEQGRPRPTELGLGAAIGDGCELEQGEAPSLCGVQNEQEDDRTRVGPTVLAEAKQLRRDGDEEKGQGWRPWLKEGV